MWAIFFKPKALYPGFFFAIPRTPARISMENISKRNYSSLGNLTQYSKLFYPFLILKCNN